MNYASRLLCSAVAVGTAWSTGIVRVIPPLLHGYADVTVTAALILLLFILGFDNSTAIQSSAGAAITRALLLPLWRSSSRVVAAPIHAEHRRSSVAGRH
jgi:hypothetical protein